VNENSFLKGRFFGLQTGLAAAKDNAEKTEAQKSGLMSRGLERG
jgi:hypothetical protein